jgi:hypothetical protein
VSDIFQEVDEEVRREQLKKLWERYQTLVYVAVVLIIIGVGGWRGYEWWESKRAAEIGTAFEEAMTLAESGKRAEAEAAFDKIAKEGSAGYRALARLRAAAEIAERDPAAAITAYEQIADDSSVGQVLQDLAGVRAGALLVDASAFDKAKARLEPLTASGRTFRHTARELLALAAWRSGDAVAAKRWFDLIMTDAETPQATRSRVEMLNALGGTEAKG